MTDSRVDYGNLWDISQHHNLAVTNVERNLRSAGCESEESPLSFGNRPHHSSGQIGILCNLCIRLAKKHNWKFLVTYSSSLPTKTGRSGNDDIRGLFVMREEEGTGPRLVSLCSSVFDFIRIS